MPSYSDIQQHLDEIRAMLDVHLGFAKDGKASSVGAVLKMQDRESKLLKLEEDATLHPPVILLIEGEFSWEGWRATGPDGEPCRPEDLGLKSDGMEDGNAKLEHHAKLEGLRPQIVDWIIKQRLHTLPAENVAEMAGTEFGLEIDIDTLRRFRAYGFLQQQLEGIRAMLDVHLELAKNGNVASVSAVLKTQEREAKLHNLVGAATAPPHVIKLVGVEPGDDPKARKAADELWLTDTGSTAT